MKRSTVVARSFRYFLRSNTSLVLGVAVATAVITGALVIGDCMRGSLRTLVVSRLANLVLLLQSRHFFDLQILDQLDIGSFDDSLSAAPFIHLSNCSAENRSVVGNELGQTSKATSQATEESMSASVPGFSGWASASRVQLFAIDNRFIDGAGQGSENRLIEPPGPDEVILNESLAKELRAKVGDEVTLRFGETSGIPGDNPLGRRDAGTINLPRQKIVGIISDQSFGGMNFQVTQESTLNAFANLASLQDLMETSGQANAIAVFSSHAGSVADNKEMEIADLVSQRLRPKLEDYGFQMHRRQRVFPDASRGESTDQETSTIFDYYQVSSKDLLIDEWSAQQMTEALKGYSHYRCMTYLANTICKIEPLSFDYQRVSSGRGRSDPWIDFGAESVAGGSQPPHVGRLVPYSIVLGVEPEASDLELERHTEYSPRDLRPPHCWINSWLSRELELQPGDWIQMQFYDPETVDGELKESLVRLMVAGIIPLEEPDRPFRRNRAAEFSRRPTRFNDPDLTPTVPGITNQESIANWDVPFELSEKDLILPQDDDYWENHRLTPKIIIPFAHARNFFFSRFGVTTAIHVPVAENVSEPDLRSLIEASLLTNRETSGFVFRPIRFQHLSAASGTTPFDALFLSLSTFVIVSALLLVALLFKLGFQQREPQLGLFLAQGFTLPQVRRMLLQEMTLVVALGVLLGIPLGMGYARLLVAGLESWWIGAIQTRFLQFFVSPNSLIVGAASGALASLATITLSFVTLSRLRPLSLLRGDSGSNFLTVARPWKAGVGVASISMLVAVLLGFLAFGQLGMIRAACFFGSGILLLIACLLATYSWLRAGYRNSQPQRQHLGSLALRAIVRNPTRSTLTIGLLSVATFLVASMSVFQTNPSELGYGGFDLIGVSNQPIYENLGSPNARKRAIGAVADEILGSTVIPIRMSEGDDASCNNLYQVARPTLLGVSEKLHKLSDLTNSFKFSWAATSNEKSPWQAIQNAATGDRGMRIPVILDQNTALWSLKQGGHLNATIRLEIGGRDTYFQVVGLLSNSVLQGKLMISESNFERLFPKISGYRYFLIDSGDSIESDKVASVLEKGWSDAGMDVVQSHDVLDKLLSVQNTYISAFQSLGGLGILLGTVGLIAVQLRSILERRRELALMQAVGFSSSRLVHLLSLETAILLGTGMTLGLACSAIALVPYFLDTGQQLSVLQPVLMVLGIICCGIVAAVISSRVALRLPLLASLSSQ